MAFVLIQYSIAVYSTFLKGSSVSSGLICLFRTAVYNSLRARVTVQSVRKAFLGIRIGGYLVLQ